MEGLMANDLLEPESRMGRKKKQPEEQPRRNDVPARIDSDVLEDVRLVATFRKISISEYLSDIVRPIAKRDLEAELARRSHSMAEEKKRKSAPDR
jgi:hypothetical protein